jgi:3-hydroxyisobutyrate dehydrogenase
MGVSAAFVGLGVMGFPMAGHLHKAKHQMTVYNRNSGKAKLWQEKYGGKTAATPGEAAAQADFIFVCVGNDDDVRQVCTGPEGIFPKLKPGSVVIDNTTTSAIVAREMATLAEERGCSFLDAPVSGGQSGAENGKLTVMVGGNEEAFAKAKPIIQAYSASVRLLGPSGYGQLTKMVNQICIAGLVQGLSEAINFGQKAGLDIPEVISVISKGAASSWQMQNRWETMMNDKFDFGFAVDLMRKDLKIACEQATELGVQLPITRSVDGFYEEVQQMGGGRWDTSSLIARLR